MADKEEEDMRNEETLNHIKWLINRNDFLRTSYSNRAVAILAANSLVIATLFFIVEDVIPEANRARSGLAAVSALTATLAAIAALVSVCFAIPATVGLRRSKKVAGYDRPVRLFLNSGETLEKLKSFAEFSSCLLSIGSAELAKGYSGELWVILKLQFYRYRYLRLSVLFLSLAILGVVAAVLVPWVSAIFSLLPWHHA